LGRRDGEAMGGCLYSERAQVSEERRKIRVVGGYTPPHTTKKEKERGHKRKKKKPQNQNEKINEKVGGYREGTGPEWRRRSDRKENYRRSWRRRHIKINPNR